MSSKPNIGLHLRITSTLENLVKQALELKLNLFQFFLVEQTLGSYITLTAKEKQFFAINRARFNNVFIHSSYWINPAAAQPGVFEYSKKLLRREIAAAKALEIPYLVLHPGSAKGQPVTKNDPDGKQAGIQTLARMINSVLKSENDVQILLENTAHGKKTIGNNLGDFVRIKQELHYPEKVGFCLDFAHAFSYGYDLKPTDDFVRILDQNLNLKKIKLIHFNDTHDVRGSMQDRHAFPGMGNIGKEALQALLNHPKLKGIPAIIEAPSEEITSMQDPLADVKTW